MACKPSSASSNRTWDSSSRSRLRSLIEAQDRLADSRLRLLESQVRLELALLGLQAIGGDLLERFDVTVAP